MNENKETPHIRHEFDDLLSELQDEMLRMGGMVEARVNSALELLSQRDYAQARELVSGDAEINDMEIKIDQDCARIIARWQPAARDLRLILAVSRCIFDLERIGDEATKILRAVPAMADQDIPEGFVGLRIGPLGHSVAAMVRGALDAFARGDVAAAYEVSRQDRDVDEIYRNGILSLIRVMEKDSGQVAIGVTLLGVLRSLERVGDHACNITEHLIYFIRGKDVRHLDTSDKAEVVRGERKQD